MLTLSNFLSLLRAPLALLFLIEDSSVRVLAILGAMFTDSIDGFLARRYQKTSRMGAILDPLMDKFFVVFALLILFLEKRLLLWEGIAMISRDFSLCLFGLYLVFSNYWKSYEFRSIRWGKISTALQFTTLTLLSIDVAVPMPVFLVFILFGFLAFYELIQSRKKPLSAPE